MATKQVTTRQVQDEDLDRLEEDIRKTKNKYDMFWAGIQKTPPMTERRNIDIAIHELNKQKMRDNGRRFRFNTLTSRWNQYREMWGRKTREREEGPIEFNRRKAALEAPLPEPHKSTGLFPHANPGELFVWLGVATGIGSLAAAGHAPFSVAKLALAYFIVGLFVNLLKGIVTEWLTGVIAKREGVTL